MDYDSSTKGWTEYNGLCEDRVRAKINNVNAAITKDHLMGTGVQTMIREQLRMPPETYNQARKLAVKALKSAGR